MCSASPPPPPDLAGAAQAQGAANTEAALTQGMINNPNVVNPYGTQTVSWNGAQPTITQTLSPEQQRLLAARTATQQQIAGLGSQAATTAQGIIGKPIDVSNLPRAGTAYNPTGAPTALDPHALPGMPTAYTAPNNLPAMPADSQAIRDQVINAMMTRSNSDIGKHEEQVKSDLIAGGLRPGTEAYQREMDTIGRQRNDAEQQAILAGGQAAKDAYGMDLSTRQEAQGEALANSNQAFSQGMNVRGTAAGEQATRFSQQGQANQQAQSQQGQQYTQQQDLRRQAIAEALAQRQIPLNEITALLSGSQVSNPFSMPGAAQNTTVAPAPVFGAAQGQNQYGMDVYNAQAGTANTNNQAMASAAVMAAMFF